MRPPLSVPQTIAVLRERHPDALICRSCARLLTSDRRRFPASITDEQAAAYECAECRSDAREAAKTKASRAANLERFLRGEKKPARGRLLKADAKAAPRPFDAESQALLRSAHFLETAPAGEESFTLEAVMRTNAMRLPPWWTGQDNAPEPGLGRTVEIQCIRCQEPRWIWRRAGAPDALETCQRCRAVQAGRPADDPLEGPDGPERVRTAVSAVSTEEAPSDDNEIEGFQHTISVTPRLSNAASRLRRSAGRPRQYDSPTAGDRERQRARRQRLALNPVPRARAIHTSSTDHVA